MSHIVYLSLGSNKGDRSYFINKAIELISSFAIIDKIAPFIETKSWGYDSENLYINTAIRIITKLSALDLLKKINEIELSLGRNARNNIDKANQIYEDRTIDIDIIFYDDCIIDEENLKVPHPHFRTREFVLYPLLELDASLIDPLTKSSIKDIIEDLEKNKS